MKRIISLVAFLLALMFLVGICAGCKNQKPGSMDASSDSTETTNSTQETGNVADVVTVVKVQDSKNIVTISNATIGDMDMSNNEYWSYVLTEKAIVDYQNGYTPLVSKMENGVPLAAPLQSRRIFLQSFISMEAYVTTVSTQKKSHTLRKCIPTEVAQIRECRWQR